MSSQFVQHKQRGNDYYRSGKYHDAVTEYTKCIDIDHLNYLPFANRAMCYLKIGKYQKAQNDCTKCLQINKKYVKGYLRRGSALKALGEFQLSLNDFKMALKLQPKNTYALHEIDRIKEIINTKLNKNKIFYGELVIGTPGSGKTTYCAAKLSFMSNVLHRNVVIINLDPNNENMEYDPIINICDLITSDDVAKYLDLGPNGSLIYCLEYLSSNMEWLRSRLNAINIEDTYLIFDCPGQVELYIHHSFMRKMTDIIVNEWHYRLCCVNLIDCHHCCDSSNFISVALMTTSMMLHLELPHINVLSKCDLMEHYDKHIMMPLEFYTEGQDLERLSQFMYNNKNDDELLDIEKRFKQLNNELAQCINDYGLVSFVKFSITDLNSMKDVCKLVDKAIGYDLCGQHYNHLQFSKQELVTPGVENPLLQNTPFH